MNPKTFLCVVGTRPEAIKMAPVILALRKEKWARVRVLATAQHREMLDQVLRYFAIVPDIDLNVMQPNQSLSSLTARLLTGLTEVLASERPDAVIGQGDTTTVMAAAMACFYGQVPFGHVEAGLRTGDMQNPFPEEANRVIAGRLTTWHFAPTESARENLRREGTPEAAITVTGNTVIDALLNAAKRPVPLDLGLEPGARTILVTCHRRENFGQPLQNIVAALRRLAKDNPTTQILFPVHPNPNVSQVVHETLSGVDNIVLCEPLEYPQFVTAMNTASLIISDSGGVQEEAPALGKPVLVLRNETERPEAVEMGLVRLVGTNERTILENAQVLLDDPAAYRAMARGVSPYGDGKAANRIVAVLRQHFS